MKANWQLGQIVFKCECVVDGVVICPLCTNLHQVTPACNHEYKVIPN